MLRKVASKSKSTSGWRSLAAAEKLVLLSPHHSKWCWPMDSVFAVPSDPRKYICEHAPMRVDVACRPPIGRGGLASAWLSKPCVALTRATCPRDVVRNALQRQKCCAQRSRCLCRDPFGVSSALSVSKSIMESAIPTQRVLQTVDSGLYLEKGEADIFWLLFGTVLVFLMQAGFALLEVGSVRSKNTKNILTKNILDASYGAILWWLVGFGVAIGQAGPASEDTNIEEILGETYYALAYDFGRRPDGNIYATWMFQWAFAATAVTIVSGVVAERVTFIAYFVYATVLICLVYPVVVHSAWNANGWATAFREDEPGSADLLLDCGVIDFAGSGVVHMTGGVAGLVAAIFVGPRKVRREDRFPRPHASGRFSASGEPIDIPGQSPIYRNLGTFILWFGWFGFNGVSTLYIGDGFSVVASKTMVTTVIAAAAGCLTCTVVGKATTNIIDLDLAGNGVLAGLVSITAPCSTCEPYGALAIGIIGGLIYIGSSKLLVFMKIDDVVDAIPVHGFCGAWGVIAAGLFATDFNYEAAYYSARADDCAGAFYVDSGNALGAAVAFVVFIFFWVGVTMSIVFGTLSVLGVARVDEEAEEMGLDEHHHGGAEPDSTSSGATVHVSTKE
eukprot:scaffold1534_cov267-Pinguiococcus_pyrenoidosus.AAC.6